MFSKTVLKAINNFFKKPLHPFNIEQDGGITYPEWQFEKGEETLYFYLKKYNLNDILKDKVLLDIGCGAAGKSLYYAKMGAKFVYGVDVVEKYQKEAEELADKKNLKDKFEFKISNAKNLPFENESIDTVILNDAMEHIQNPNDVLNEAIRVLKTGGKIFINFPPYHHPFGAHLSDCINIPWVHLFFSEKVLINSYKDLVKNYKDGNERIRFRISKNKQGKEYFSYINKMTIKRFKKIIKNGNYKVCYYSEEPLRPFLYLLSKIPFIKECFVKMVVCVIEK